MHSKRMVKVFKPVVLLLAVCAVMAAAPDSFTRDELDTLVAEKQEAERKLQALQQAGDETLSDLSNIDSQLLSAAMESQRREDQAASAEKSLIDLGARRVTAQMALLEDRQSMEDLLAALAASNRRKPPALVVSPGKANTAVRRAILMSSTMPRLASRADGLTEEIDELNRLERRIRGEKARLEAAEATLALKQVEIERLAAAKRGQFEDLSGDIARLQAQAAALGSEAKTLEDLLAALESNAPTAPGVKPAIRPRLVATTPTRRPSASPASVRKSAIIPTRQSGARRVEATRVRKPALRLRGCIAGWWQNRVAHLYDTRRRSGRGARRRNGGICTTVSYVWRNVNFADERRIPCYSYRYEQDLCSRRPNGPLWRTGWTDAKSN